MFCSSSIIYACLLAAQSPVLDIWRLMGSGARHHLKVSIPLSTALDIGLL